MKSSDRAILSLNDFAWQLGTTVDHLMSLAGNIKANYREWSVREGQDKFRHVCSPSKELKKIQRKIVRCVLNQFPLGEMVQGGVRDRSPASNAKAHTKQRCLVTMDVRSFFPSVRHGLVFLMFRKELGFGRDVARLLTRLTTHMDQLPQGAPTSVAVANLLLATVDKEVEQRAREHGVRVTRFVDDYAFSGHFPTHMVNVAAGLLSGKRLRVHRQHKSDAKSKLRIMNRSDRQEVTGLLVNAGRPTISRARRDRIRAAIHQLRSEPNKTKVGAAVKSIQGRIIHVRQFHPGTAARLERQLKGALANLSL